MLVDLTSTQMEAVAMAEAAARTPGSVAVLSGAAGTGKTTALSGVLRALPGCVVTAPTGKAAHRAGSLFMRADAHPMAPPSTMHSWMYAYSSDDHGGIRCDRKPVGDVLRPRSGLVIIDESSMVGRGLWRDAHLTVTGIAASVLLVGDGHQLPPYDTDKQHPFTVFAPRFPTTHRTNLLEVHRQAAGSPPIRAATFIRQCTRWDTALGAARRILPAVTVHPADRMAQLLTDGVNAAMVCFTNRKRMELNSAIRTRLGFLSTVPEAGEPLLVKQNNHDAGLMNGQVVRVKWLGHELRMGKHTLREVCVVDDDTQRETRCAIDASAVMTDPAPKADWQLSNAMKERLGLPLVAANLGYALTCHASQGSEWDHVLVLPEYAMRYRLTEQDCIRWLYTAVTRSKTTTEMVDPRAVKRAAA